MKTIIVSLVAFLSTPTWAQDMSELREQSCGFLRTALNKNAYPICLSCFNDLGPVFLQVCTNDCMRFQGDERARCIRNCPGRMHMAVRECWLRETK